MYKNINIQIYAQHRVSSQQMPCGVCVVCGMCVVCAGVPTQHQMPCGVCVCVCVVCVWFVCVVCVRVHGGGFGLEFRL